MSTTKSKFKLEFELIQQTPLIHFQCDEPGACLRATEVKPKLDRFIHSWIEKKNEKLDNTKKIKIPSNWYVNKKDKENKPAFNYQMHFVIKDTERPSTNIVDHPLFLGNMGIQNVKDKKKSIVFSKPIEGKITSFAKGKIHIMPNTVETENNQAKDLSLLQILESLLELFFMTNNFGMRQTKGFGSFTLDTIIVESSLKVELTDIYPCYFYTKCDKSVFDDIWVISGLMKSGFNLPKGSNYYKGHALKYIHKFKCGNDKAFIKQKVLTGDGSKHEECNEKLECTNKDKQQNYKFVRAMLGLPGFYKYRDSVRKGTVKINHDTIKRFASPVLFKVNKNILYVFPKEIPLQMFNTSFEFNKKNISTPTATEFVLVDFLTDFMNSYNNISKKFESTKIQNTLNRGFKILKVNKLDEEVF